MAYQAGLAFSGKMCAFLERDLGRKKVEKDRNLPALTIAPSSSGDERFPCLPLGSWSVIERKKNGASFSNMRPPIGNKHLHLINQTFLPMFIILSILLHPLLHRLLHYPGLNSRGNNPPQKPIRPYPQYACSKTRIYAPTMDSLVCGGTISDADIWVQPDAFGIGEGVVDVD